ncbi:MAG TPA: ribosome-associated translation inhibitor RaiA [Burkholderiales bacterium]|nr:ribosome-associated translation inhibitor RaiA [Burkholderiales bacterium]
MNINLSGHHVEITPAIRDYVKAKLGRVASHFDHVIDINAILSVEKLKQKIEATVHMPGRDFFAECSDANMYAAIDNLADKLDRQIMKHKEKTIERRLDGEDLKIQASE